MALHLADRCWVICVITSSNVIFVRGNCSIIPCFGVLAMSDDQPQCLVYRHAGDDHYPFEVLSHGSISVAHSHVILLPR